MQGWGRGKDFLSAAPFFSPPPCWAWDMASRKQVLAAASLPFSIVHVPLKLMGPHALPRGL